MLIDFWQSTILQNFLSFSVNVSNINWCLKKQNLEGTLLVNNMWFSLFS